MLCSLTPREFNSYGSRRGNDAVMARGTFANIRLLNKFIGKAAPKTVHIPSGDKVNYYPGTIRLPINKIIDVSMTNIMVASRQQPHN